MHRVFSPSGFRQSLESRLQMISKERGTDLQRVRRKVAFDRLLTRLFSVQPCPWVLKGGYALEVRFNRSRATKDLDLGVRLDMAGTVDQQKAMLLEQLQECAAWPIQDHFVFRVEPNAKLIEAAPGGGFRFSISSLVAGRLFVAFSLDIGLGDAITPPIEELEGVDWLDFCGIPPARFEAISLEQQFAEKIHAMTVDRGDRENSRVKDFVDVLLLIDNGLDRDQVVKCLTRTFHRRREPIVPFHRLHLPGSWRPPFNRMAIQCGLDPDFDAAAHSLSRYWDDLHFKGSSNRYGGADSPADRG